MTKECQLRFAITYVAYRSTSAAAFKGSSHIYGPPLFELVQTASLADVFNELLGDQATQLQSHSGYQQRGRWIENLSCLIAMSDREQSVK